MLALHQRTRRRLCQLGFCLFCVLPTTGLLAWSTGLKTAAHQLQCRQALSERLGLDVRFERASYPQPGLTRFEPFELADAETGEWVLRCRFLDMISSGRKIAIDPHEVELAAKHADKLRRLVTRRLTHEIPGEASLSLLPTQVTLTSADASQTYDDVAGRIEMADEGATATLRFRLPEHEEGEPPLFSISRRRTDSGMGTTAKLATLGAELPVSMLSPWLDLTGLLGADATFQGTLAIDEEEGQYGCQAAGVLADIDLERLIGRRFPQHIVGRATIEIKRVRLESGRLVEAMGVIRSPLGEIGGSLLLAAVDMLGCQPGAAPAGKLPFASGRNDEYRNLALSFRIDERGLLLTSLSSAQPAGALLLNKRGTAILTSPMDGPVPLVQLVRALSPASDLLVPATKETSQLTRWLPLPPVIRPPDARPQTPPLRMPD